MTRKFFFVKSSSTSFFFVFKRAELNKEKEISLHEKARLKETIKKYESDFNKANNRSLNKEDREFHREDFERYKVSFLL